MDCCCPMSRGCGGSLNFRPGKSAVEQSVRAEAAIAQPPGPSRLNPEAGVTYNRYLHRFSLSLLGCSRADGSRGACRCRMRNPIYTVEGAGDSLPRLDVRLLLQHFDTMNTIRWNINLLLQDFHNINNGHHLHTGVSASHTPTGVDPSQSGTSRYRAGASPSAL